MKEKRKKSSISLNLVNSVILRSMDLGLSDPKFHTFHVLYTFCLFCFFFCLNCSTYLIVIYIIRIITMKSIGGQFLDKNP
jgi:hypothetical protein